MLIFFLSFAGILSAYGLALANVVHEAQEPCSRVYNKGKNTVVMLNRRYRLMYSVLKEMAFLRLVNFVSLSKIC